MKKLLFRFVQTLCLCSFVLMLVHHSLILKYAKEGLFVWASCVLPLLLPFILLSKFWIRYEIPELFFHQAKKRFSAHTDIAVTLPVFLLGLCCGFPVGAIFIAHYYQNGTLGKQQAETLLPLASFVSPMFVMGYIHSQTGLTGTFWLRYLLVLYLPVIICYLFTQLVKKPQKSLPLSHRVHSLSRNCPPSNHIHSLSQKTSDKLCRLRLKEMTDTKRSLTEEIWIPSLEVILIIGIYMMIFSILLGMLTRLSLFQKPFFTFLLSNLEVTTGIRLLAANKIYTSKMMYSLTAATASFGGMCTMAQVQTVTSDSGLSLKPYVIIKLLTAEFSFFLSLLLL